MREYFIWLAKLVTLAVMVMVLLFGSVAILALAVNERSSEHGPKSDKLVGVVKLDGEIIDSAEILEDLYKYAADKDIDGIVLRIDSPGGAVGPSQEIYSAVERLKSKKPIVASMGALAASGGLYSALSASKVFAQPGTLTGSIGVIMQIPNLSKVANQLGVDMVTIKSGALKDVGNMFREMTPEEREFLQQTVMTVRKDFVEAVSKGRNIDLATVEKFADGRVIVGSDAKRLGLIDEFGDMFAAARAVYDLKGTPLKEGEYPRLRSRDQSFESFKKFFEGAISLPRMFSRPIEIKYLLQ